MIETFYLTGALNSLPGFIAATIIGVLFGVILERVGFGSARRLSAVFYLRDMVVFKVMLSALTTAAIGYTVMLKLGWIGPTNAYLLPSIPWAYAVGGAIFGVGFAMAGWCPGTAAVGAASGKLDAGLFLVGVLGGSIIFNEAFPLISSFYERGDVGVRYLHESLGMARGSLLVILSISSVMAFAVCEWVERRDQGQRLPEGVKAVISDVWHVSVEATRKDRPLRFTVGLLVALPLFLLLFTADHSEEQKLLTMVADGRDHMEPETVARRVVNGDSTLMMVDVRPAEEFASFHIKGALNIELKDLHDRLTPHKNIGEIVLYSNGMTHPAQARDSLFRGGFENVYMMTDGLNGFIDRCLTPVSLRKEPVPEPYAVEIAVWRAYFLSPTDIPPDTGSQTIVENEGGAEPY